MTSNARAYIPLTLSSVKTEMFMLHEAGPDGSQQFTTVTGLDRNGTAPYFFKSPHNLIVDWEQPSEHDTVTRWCFFDVSPTDQAMIHQVSGGRRTNGF